MPDLQERELYLCPNCESEWELDDLKEIQDIFERVSPGEIMPAGECPECGALCHQKESSNV